MTASRRLNAERVNSAEHADRHTEELTAEQVDAVVTTFGMLADATRLRILWALRDAEVDVATLAELAGCRPTVASQHLAKLRLAGLVGRERDGRRVVYRLQGAHTRALLTEALFHADHQVGD